MAVKELSPLERVKRIITWGLSTVNDLSDDEIRYLGTRGLIDPCYEPIDTVTVSSPLLFIWGVEFTTVFELKEGLPGCSLWGLCVAPFPLSNIFIHKEECYELVAYDNFDDERLSEMLSREDFYSEAVALARNGHLEGWMLSMVKERRDDSADRFLLALLMEKKYKTVEKMIDKGVLFSPELKRRLMTMLNA